MPTENPDILIDLVKQHGRAIAHMRKLVSQRRLGLALGAGISQSVGFPSWDELLERITRRLDQDGVEGHDLATESAPMRAQILHSRFRKHIESDPTFADVDASHRDATIASRWRTLLRDMLYRDVDDPAQLAARHRYLHDLAVLAFSVPVVITYNFDDLLERAVATSDKRPSGTVGYYSAWGPSFVIQEGRPVIYHPNGYIPFHVIDRCSERVVLTEEALSDQIIDSVMGSYGLLLNYYCRSPCLFLGFSLTDPGLRSMLRQSARRSPGTVHYYIRYCSGAARQELQKPEIEEATKANFDLFNMVTLYLTDAQIKALLQLVACLDHDAFNDIYVRAGRSTKYFYYIAGPVSVGKTAVISRLQGLEIVDEWLKPRDPLIAKPSNQLTKEEKERVDEYILEQLRLKNSRFEMAQLGFYVMDRAPLDAFAFTPLEEYRTKAQSMYEVACAGASGTPHEFCPGKLIVLTGHPYDLLTRQKWRGREGTEEYIRDQQNTLVDIYSDAESGDVSFVETSGLNIESVVKEVSRRMHLEPYKEFSFNNRLKKYLSDK
jgi:hypothetical protein